MEKDQPIVPSKGFPGQLAPDSEKESETYGLRIGQAIQYEWFRKDSVGGRFYSQWREFHRLKMYARGEQSVEKYKNELAVNGDLSYLNLDWTPVPILPKFVDIVVNGMSDRFFKVKANAQDAMSSDMRNRFQESIELQMAGKPLFEALKKKMGVDAFTIPETDIPETDDELQLYMQMNYKPSIEIAEEQAI